MTKFNTLGLFKYYLLIVNVVLNFTLKRHYRKQVLNDYRKMRNKAVRQIASSLLAARGSRLVRS